MAKKKTEEKFNLDTILFKCRDIFRFRLSLTKLTDEY